MVRDGWMVMSGEGWVDGWTVMSVDGWVDGDDW